MTRSSANPPTTVLLPTPVCSVAPTPTLRGTRSQIKTMQALIRNLSDIARDVQPSVNAKKPYNVARLRELRIAQRTVLLPLQCTLTPQLPAVDIGRQADELHPPRAGRGGGSAAAGRRRPILESKQVFPEDARIYVARFDEWAEVMASKEKPKRIKITGTNEQKFVVVCAARVRPATTRAPAHRFAMLLCGEASCDASSPLASWRLRASCLRYSFLIKAEKTGDLRKDMCVAHGGFSAWARTAALSNAVLLPHLWRVCVCT